jgi:hypothetical protein
MPENRALFPNTPSAKKKRQTKGEENKGFKKITLRADSLVF